MMMALMPMVGFLVHKVQPKYLILGGFVVSALALYHLCGLESGVSFRVMSIARIYQGVGFAFLFVPIQTLAYADLPA
ncbi:MAG TPA: EmrB/QacA family drug resistance transporter, partial [Verrucomicrobiae bacterium]